MREMQALKNGELNRMEETKLFCEEMKEAQKAAMEKRWKDFKKRMMENQGNILTQFDLLGNNAIHVATRSHPELLREMIEMVPVAERWHALCKQNGEGNSVLHEIVFSKKAKEMAEVVFRFEHQLLPQEMEEQRPLLELRNNRGETPLFVAAMHGKLKILKYMAKRVEAMDNLPKHFRRSDKYNALHASVIGQHFHVAIWLQRKDETLALERDEKQLTSLQLLSKMPQVFRSHIHLGLVKSAIYILLPDEYDNDDEHCLLFKQKKDEENGEENEPQICKSAVSKINYSFWKRLAKEFEGIDHMWKEKKKHKLAEQLASTLVTYDLSWQVSNNEYNRTLLITMPRDPLNVAKRRRVSVQKREERRKNTEERPERPALFIAAKTGIVEIVKTFLEVYPASIYHVTKNKQNILTMAVKYRQKKILKIIERTGTMESLVGQITDKGRTVLHEVARMDYYKAEHLAGVAFHLQDELRWYDTVRRFTPKHYNMHSDIDGHTPEDMLEIEHDGMLKEAQKWLKETAQSCSTVAILVATVVFAAAYTIPGGTENGTPVFLHSSEFLFFTIMDVVALATSLASVVVFLSILTSPCELWDFHKSLPRKLNLGFALLFLSLMTTMLAFSATMLLTIRLEWKNWTSTLIYSAAFFPVTIFAIIQFPVYVMVRSITKHLWKQVKKVFPTRLIEHCMSNC
ncbi:hypothetical protein LR48_Vigan11g149900 [Vigna angularis]|uniref:Ankyrin repeat-containing protein n=3 Tax=Vigna TaxID=3913 RepID=A0A0L9VTS9_PHAAN|nr:uncharacterized protein LOC108347162 isoform X1 [Vigna angularis]KAG2381020.1 Ankyrin repeat-containing protein [Vigna angularis]KOM58465.1 hypothetical protein LR48_Vigan11g149900 [Vigna angularis]BAT96966.1 hypothetical protein VIGAN_09029800 [Vigna angularis var. angularis]